VNIYDFNLVLSVVRAGFGSQPLPALASTQTHRAEFLPFRLGLCVLWVGSSYSDSIVDWI
jgi:hypothetical protein